jgi:hypothetical protein
VFTTGVTPFEKGINMKKFRHIGIVILCCILFFSWCYSQDEKKHEISQAELTASVPELADLHEAIYPLWHDAFPNKDYTLIKRLLPQLDSLTARLDMAKLPGILREKQPAWDEGKKLLLGNLKFLHTAVAQNNQQGMLDQTDQLHASFERLMRTIRPLSKELDSFHQEMYKLYHYYMPDYELENIRTTVTVMQEKIPLLKQAQLPKRLADRKKSYDEAVAKLEAAINKLAETVKKDNKKAIGEAVEKAHTAYQQTQAVFD